MSRLLFATLVTFALGAASAAADTPNIVVVIVDDMGWPSTSVQMDPDLPESKSDFHLTPNLERMAQEGLRFDQAYAAGPICSPTRASLQTGKSPAQLRVTDVRNGGKLDNPRFLDWYNGHPLTPPQPIVTVANQTTIAEALKNVNPSYRTGFFGKWDWWPHPRDDGYDKYAKDFFKLNPPFEDPAGMFSLTEHANQFMEDQVNEGNPFFMIVAHDSVKLPGARQSTIDMFEDLPDGDRHDLPEYAARHYDLDASVGLLLDKIEDLQIDDNTYVVFTSDHGAAIGINDQERQNLPLFGGKGTVWEGGLRVPMLLKGPTVTAGGVSSLPVNTSDLYPTLVQLAGGGSEVIPTTVEGASLKHVLENGGQLPQGETSLVRAFGEQGELFFHFPHYGPNLPSGRPSPASAIRDNDYKLVRIYGEDGAPDELLLFDLATNPEESSDPASPLNIASAMPGRVHRLEKKLDRWLEGVDASLPYDVRAEVRLAWSADQPGPIVASWRATTDVDYYDREVMGRLGTVPTNVAVAPHQNGLPRSAFQFDGNQGFQRRFFHVSDATAPDDIDADHSATFQLWARLDDLHEEQVLLEAGDANQGLSLTLGDAHQDGTANDLRFRVLGKRGNHLTITAPLDRFADPTRDFVHITGVINDDENDRYLELYVNGALAGRSDGQLGSNELDWDAFGRASLGAAPSSPDGFGGSAGGGELPFTAGNLRGEIATFEFTNVALSPAGVEESYADALVAPGTGIDSVANQAQVALQRPASSAEGQFEADVVQIIHERTDTLDADLLVDIDGDASGIYGNGNLDLAPAVVSAGTQFSSYLIHLDPVGTPGDGVTAVGSVEFQREILGVLLLEERLASTDVLLGSMGEFATADRALDLATDSLALFGDSHTLAFALSTSGQQTIDLRVLTASAEAYPGDFDLDSLVTAADLALWHTALGDGARADGDFDGDSDGGDFLVWQAQFTAAAAGGGGTAVPEPSTVSWGLLALATLVARRNRSESRPVGRS